MVHFFTLVTGICNILLIQIFQLITYIVRGKGAQKQKCWQFADKGSKCLLKISTGAYLSRQWLEHANMIGFTDKDEVSDCQQKPPHEDLGLVVCLLSKLNLTI